MLWRQWPTTYQFHDSSGPGGEQFDALLGHVHQLLGRLIIEGEVAASDDLLQVGEKGGMQEGGREGGQEGGREREEREGGEGGREREGGEGGEGKRVGAGGSKTW